MSDSSNPSSAMQSGSSMTMIENSRGNIGVGNYKGVMLCNRPFGGTTALPRQAGHSESAAFTCGVISDIIGTNVTISSKDKHRIERPKKGSVISKHRKWLADLQKQKDSLELQYISEMAQKKETHDKFTEHESKLRKLAKAQDSDAREYKNLGDSASDYTESKDSDAKADCKSSTAITVLPRIQSKTSSSITAPSKSSSLVGSSSSSSKPAWALTETASIAASDAEELDDEDELLSFAEGLDFDRLIDDMELQSVMDQLKSRISAMEKDAAIKDQRDEATEDRIEKKKLLAQMVEATLNLSVGGQEEKCQSNREAAKSLLQGEEGADLRAVHSNKSLSALIKSSSDKIQAEGPRVLYHPIVVVHLDDDGARLAKHSAVGNLPYMHRSPAV